MHTFKSCCARISPTQVAKNRFAAILPKCKKPQVPRLRKRPKVGGVSGNINLLYAVAICKSRGPSMGPSRQNRRWSVLRTCGPILAQASLTAKRRGRVILRRRNDVFGRFSQRPPPCRQRQMKSRPYKILMDTHFDPTMAVCLVARRMSHQWPGG